MFSFSCTHEDTNSKLSNNLSEIEKRKKKKSIWHSAWAFLPAACHNDSRRGSLSSLWSYRAGKKKKIKMFCCSGKKKEEEAKSSELTSCQAGNAIVFVYRDVKTGRLSFPSSSRSASKLMSNSLSYKWSVTVSNANILAWDPPGRNCH